MHSTIKTIALAATFALVAQSALAQLAGSAMQGGVVQDMDKKTIIHSDAIYAPAVPNSGGSSSGGSGDDGKLPEAATMVNPDAANANPGNPKHSIHKVGISGGENPTGDPAINLKNAKPIGIGGKSHIVDADAVKKVNDCPPGFHYEAGHGCGPNAGLCPEGYAAKPKGNGMVCEWLDVAGGAHHDDVCPRGYHRSGDTCMP